ncbi:MAG: protoporphyrinogen oxidase [Elusimicrobia bacterium]|nr:protoporphyrinogen oxidase [Elusimicrobiota bacterium]
MTRLIVVGGGVAGLSAAHRIATLAKEGSPGVEVLLLEATARPGGKILTERVPGAEPGADFIVEGGPDSFMTAKPAVLELVEELGLVARLLPTNPDCTDVYIYARGRLRRIPAGFSLMGPTRIGPFLRADFMSWLGKFRMALEPLVPRGGGEDESLADFAGRRFGSEAVDILVQPIMAGIYAGDASELSVHSTFPKFLELEQRYGSVLRGLRAARRPAAVSGGRTMFMTLQGGLVELAQALAAGLGPSNIRYGAQVETVGRAGHGWRVRLGDGEVLECAGLILAVPAWEAARLAAGADAELARRLEEIPFASSATASFAYRREDLREFPSGFGFVVADSEFRNISAGTFTSFKFPQRAPAGALLLRCFIGGAGREQALEAADDGLLAAAREDLRRILGIEAEPLWGRTYRWPKANPQYRVGHERLLRRIEEQLRACPGLWLTGASYRGVGIPDCVAAARETAQEAFSAVTGAKFV